MLSGDKKTEDITGSTNDNLCDSLAMNFESNRVVVGTRRNNASGQIKIYNYDSYDSGTGTANTWVLAQTITGSSSSANFGQSADMNYDGNRIVVGAPGENKVYVYDATSTSTNEWATYVSNTITGTSSSNFGFSVSLAKDISTKLAIGSPSENKVYMYELSGSSWSQTWSNVATDVPNLVPLTATTDVCMTSNNASYGYSIDLAPFGRFLAIGAPGVLTTITSSNSTYTGGTTFRDIYYDIESIVYGATGTDTGNIYQRGYIRCFTTSNVVSTWQNTTGGTGTTSLEEVTQHGQLVYGSRVSNLNNFTGENTDQSWSLPALGFSVAISVDGSKLVGGEPFYSPPGNQASIHRGNVRAWLYDNTQSSDKFQEINSGAATWFGDKFGYTVKLDYDGGRLAVGSTKRWSGGSMNEGEDHGGVHVFDFTSTAFYEVNQGNNDFDNSEVSHAAIAISNGTTVAFGAKQYTSSTGGKVRFYHLILSQVILGNTVIGGHIAADSIYIGPNNDLENNSFKKRISFGGTYKDNKYDATEIENRSFSTNLAHEGHSELLMVKKSIGAGGTGGRDMIRLKANEFQIHNYITRGHSTDDNKYDMSPRLTMSEEGNFKLNPEFLYGKYDNSTHSSCDVKALLDINGDTFCRGKLNAGHKDRSNTKGFDREQGIIFYDTRDRDIIDGTSVKSHVMSELQRENNPGTIVYSVTYNDTESAFKLGSTTSRIYNDKGGYKHDHEGLKYSCWIKLTKDHDQYSSSGETILSAGNFSSHYSKCQIYDDGVQILYNSGYKLQKSVTFIKDRWYHLFFYLNARQNTPSTSNNYLWIDGVSQTLTGSGSSSAPSNATDNFYVGSTSGSIVDAYIGMVHARNTNNGTSYVLSPSELYTNGPPSERLSVGGDATIENRLGIANVVPMYPLDVNGDINISTGSSFRINGVAQSFGGGGGSSPWTTSGSDVYRSSGNVGIATTSPGYKLDVNGSMNVSGGLYVGYPSPSAGTSGQVLTSSGGGAMSWTTVSGGGSIGDYITHDGDSDTYFGFPASDQFTIRTAGSERFHINSSGYTTIGEDNDIGTGHRLTVVDGSTSNNGSYADLVITNRNENNNARLLLGTPYNQGSTSGFKAAIIADGAGSASRSDLHFCLDNSTDNTLNATLSDSKMIIKYNGNVGIGTTSPSYKLDVDGDINMSSGSSFRINGVAQTFGGGGSSPWSTSGSDIYRSSGKVGIGESSPGAPLHIECADTSIPSQNGLLVKQTSYSYPAVIGIRSSSSSQDAFISFMINSDNTGWSYGVDASDSNKMKWGYSTTTWNDTRMTLTDDGRLGINRTSPAYNLDVNGDMKLTGGLHVNGSYGSSGQVLTSSGGGVMSWTTVSGGGGGGSSPWTTSGSNIYISSGRVGIGTTNPGAPLEIRSSGSANPFVNGLLVYNNANYSNQDSIIAVRVGGSSAGDPFISFDVANETGWAFGIDNNDGNKLKWSSNADNLTNTKMTLDTSGNLGIGTTTPGYKLDVFGTVNFTGVLTVGTTQSSGTSGQVLTSGGSASPPSWTTVSGGGGSFNGYIDDYITHNGDTDTYFGFPGDNQFVLRTGGNDRLNIDSSGRLTVPSYITHTGDTNTFFGFPLDDTFKITVGGFDRFRIISSGNIGIGTSSPGYKLDVQGDINLTGSLRINGTAQTFGGGGGGSSPWTTSGSNIYRSSGQVNIGGSTFTRAKLEVNGSYGSYLSFTYYAYNTHGGNSSGTNSYSIYCNERIAAKEFNAHSDRRIKKNITDINDSSALDKIRLLEPKIYNYIDEKGRGTSNVYGFIAQEVANVLPYAVTVSEGDIPNILRNSNVSVIDNNTVELTLESSVEELSLSNTSVINIITDKDKDLKCNVLSFSENNVITIENIGEFSNVTNAFIKGEQISDFHHLNKDAIWAVSTAALQEVDRQLQVEKEKVSTLETQVADLLARVIALENA